MNSRAEKTQEDESRSMASAVSQKQSSSNPTFQFVDNRPEAIAQRKLKEMANNSPQAEQAAQLQAMADNHSARQRPTQKKENNTGLPDNLKSGIENLSGYSMDDVKVHYNSDKPAQLRAHAYAQGADIHLAPGQEQHLPHEAWHVVQQAQGRVQPTLQALGVAINNDSMLEREANVMGKQARLAPIRTGSVPHVAPSGGRAAQAVLQGYFKSDEYELLKQGKDDEQAPFTTQAPKPTAEMLGEDKINVERKYIEHRNELPKNLLVADDLTMAIHDTEAEPKEFYATGKVVATANQKLAQVESAFGLESFASNAIKVANHTLNMVKPKKLKIEPGQAVDDKGFVSLIRHICIEMTAELTGASKSHYEVVLGNEEEGRFTKDISPDGQHSSEIDRLATHLARGGKTAKQDVLDVMSKGGQSTSYAKNFGRRQRANQLDGKERALGVNRYARPDVGEGYAVFSQSDKNDPKVKPTHTWSYHFAGVVAHSGNDRVTLENYRRDPDTKDVVHAALLNMSKFNQGVKKIRKENKVGGEELVNELITCNTEAYRVYEEALKSAVPAGKLWFFRMYGATSKQSFHEKQKADGGVVNPITVHVRRSLGVQKDAKRKAVDWALRNYSEVLDKAAIPDHRAGAVIAGIKSALESQGDVWKQGINDATSNEAMMLAACRVQKDLPGVAEAQIVMPLRQLYLEIIGARDGTGGTAANRKVLLASIRQSLAPTFAGVMFDMVRELFQGLPDADMVARDSLAGLETLLETLPDDPFI